MGSSGTHEVLALTLIYAAVVLPSISAHCAPVCGITETTIHTRLQGIRKIHTTVPAAVHATLFGKWELRVCNAFSMLSGELSTASLSSLEPTMRESQPHGTTCYRVATDFLHPVEPQALLPASDHHINCLVDSAHSTNCLAVSHCLHCSLNPW